MKDLEVRHWDRKEDGFRRKQGRLAIGLRRYKWRNFLKRDCVESSKMNVRKLSIPDIDGI